MIWMCYEREHAEACYTVLSVSHWVVRHRTFGFVLDVIYKC